MAAVGVLIGQRRECHISILVIYGIFIFFFGAIPLLVEGNDILKFTSIPESDYKLMCNMTLEQIEDKPKWTREFVQTAYRFDLMSEMLLNKYMCTERCPCLDYNVGNPDQSPKMQYDKLSESFLNKFKRTKVETEKARVAQFTPMVWE